MAEYRADAVNKLRRNNMLELAGARFKLVAKRIMDQPFGKPVGTD